jgi:Ala-tRNA(Pro) deacylase
MALSKRLQKVLADEFMWYRVEPYHDAFDAQHVAAAAHVSGDVLAKTLVLRDSEGFLMVALPASCMLDLPAVRKALTRPGLELASESEFAPLFPDCATGAMPPIGALYGLLTLADLCLLDADRVLFRGGTHESLVRTRIEDWLSVASPVVGRWCSRPRRTA